MDRLECSIISPDYEDQPAETMAIPKFASFTPKVPSAETAGGSHVISTQRQARSRQSPKGTGLQHDGELRDSISPKQRRHRITSKSLQLDRLNDRPSYSPISPTKTFEHGTGIFKIDTIGDPKNLTFGSLDRYKLPNYFRKGVGSLIGLPRSQRIDRTRCHDTEIALCTQRQVFTNLCESGTLRTTKPSKDRELMIRPYESIDTIFDPRDNFIPLAHSRSTRQRRLGRNIDTSRGSSRDYHDEEEEEDDDDDGRFLMGDAERSKGSADEDLQHLEELIKNPSKMMHTSDLPHQRRLELAQQVNSNPTDIEAWLGLIASQHNIMGADDTETSTTAADRKSIAEIKFSMYEIALKYAQKQTDRERILIGMMQEAAFVKDPVHLSTEWKNLLHRNSTYLKLWVQYLEFKQTDSLSFTYDVVSEAFLDCLRVLTQSRAKLGLDMGEQIRIFEFQIEVALRMTLFAKDSGFTEKAIAAWQVILESQIFRPLHLRKLDQTRSSDAQEEFSKAFEDFWDSELPRIGENGAGGWMYTDAGKSASMEVRREIPTETSAEEDALTIWLSRECQCSRVSRRVARTTDEIEEKDPYRVILFPDIKPFLFTLSPSNDWQLLLDAFLAFCQLPPYRDCPTFNVNLSWTNVSMRNLTVNEKEPHFPFAMPIQSYLLDQDTIFPHPGQWFSAFLGQLELCGRGPVAVEWILQTMRTLMNNGIGGDEFAEYCLGFELAVSQNTVRKTAKTLLKRRPASLRLYNAFALLQLRLESYEKCEEVIITTLKLTKQAEGAALSDSILLWRTWAWGLLATGDSAAALARLVSFPDSIELDVNIPPASQGALILRTEAAFIAERDHLLSHNKPYLAAVAVDCLVLLAYLRDPSNLSAARRTFNSNLTVFPDVLLHRTSREHLHQCFAHLIYHHTTYTGHFKSSEVRYLLEESICAFPQNTIFLSLFAFHEACFRVDDRVRSVIRDVVLKHGSTAVENESVVPHFFAIYSELGRGINFGSNTNAARATFERALESEAVTHCAGLWELYFLFEHSRGRMKEAKAVLYRSMRACPWVKSLYLLAFEHLRFVHGGMSDSELKGIYHLMGERELRIHVDLDKLLGNEGV